MGKILCKEEEPKPKPEPEKLKCVWCRAEFDRRGGKYWYLCPSCDKKSR